MSLSLIGVGKFVCSTTVCGLGRNVLSIGIHFIEPTPEAPKPKERPLEFEAKPEEAPEPFKKQVAKELPLEAKETEATLEEGRFLERCMVADWCGLGQEDDNDHLRLYRETRGCSQTD